MKLDPDTVQLEDGFIKDMRNIGHWGTGDLEIEIRKVEQLARVKQLITKCFEES